MLTNNQNQTLGFPRICQTNTPGRDIVSSRHFIAELTSLTVSGVLPASYFTIFLQSNAPGANCKAAKTNMRYTVRPHMDPALGASTDNVNRNNSYIILS